LTGAHGDRATCFLCAGWRGGAVSLCTAWRAPGIVATVAVATRGGQAQSATFARIVDFIFPTPAARHSADFRVSYCSQGLIATKGVTIMEPLIEATAPAGE
jgi:hypothetical protein